LKEEVQKMVFEEKEYMIGDKKILLRSAKTEEAQLLVDYLKTVCGETRFLLCDPDEVKYTAESEVEFINEKNSSEDSMLMLAFVDGEYAGNCSFQPIGSRRRAKHRADIGIALFQKYTGFGLGRLMLKQLLEKIKELRYEQAGTFKKGDGAFVVHDGSEKSTTLLDVIPCDGITDFDLALKANTHKKEA
jgi:RimJ/RimL family protein N-acetyltransferase